MSVDYLLHESPAGFAVFKVVSQPDTIGNRLKEVQAATQDLDKFGKLVESIGFAPFRDNEHALQEVNDLSEGIMSDFLKATLETSLPKAGKKKAITLGVWENKLAGSIKAEFPFQFETAESSQVTADLLRGIRQHEKLMKQLLPGEISRAGQGLAHSYSRSKVKYNVNKSDNHIIQAIAALDQIDKDTNQLSMRLREQYSWHFPELSRIVTNNEQYAQITLVIGDKSRLSEDDLHDIAAVVDDDEGIASAIIQAARNSMGRTLSEADMEIVMASARRTASLAAYRKQLSAYLGSKMSSVAPNLAALIGDTVGARLISKAGSLNNLAKYPASTVQILGAEKALFRALKTKGNTPKYGLIYHSSFIGRTGAKSKGRISRFLANKCSVASRIDAFSDSTPTSKWGEALKRQVDERIEFYASGATPTKNSSVMEGVLAELDVDESTSKGAEDVVMADGAASELAIHKKEKKEKKKSKEAEPKEEVAEKKSKKEKKRKGGDEEDGESKKKKKKSKSA